jgi:AmiR/NasT family two-component response regulator
MRTGSGEDYAHGWADLDAHLDRQSVIDRAIGALMEQSACGYWAAMRVLMVDAIREDVTVHRAAERVVGCN